MKKISEKNLLAENRIQKEIIKYVDSGKSFVFNSGAGAGKTFALIETLKHILKQYGDSLRVGSQNVLCVTYTNAAVEEIKVRLGDSSIVNVSTIHECLWRIIKNQQSALLKVHLEEVENKLQEASFKLLFDTDEKSEKKYSVYRNLSDVEKKEFKIYMLSVKEIFYRVRFKSSDYVREKFIKDIGKFSILSNIQNFKDTVSLIYKIENLESCRESILSQREGFKMVKYDANYNDDVLHKMIISHDTLLRYSLILFERYPILRRLIIDKYPFFLVDEYQDTSPLVVNILKILDDYAANIKRHFLVGYYGDLMQNIYGSGVGEGLFSVNPEIKIVNKIYNRRSKIEIISVINNFRDDELKQESIYEDCTGGSFKFYENKGDSEHLESINNFVELHKKEWKISNINKLHCFVLLNKTIADLNGFSTLYDQFSKFIRFDQINAELLSKDVFKLGYVPRVFFKLMHLREVINKKNISISEIVSFFDLKIENELRINEIRRFILELKKLNGDSFSQYVESIFRTYMLDDVTVFFTQIAKSIFKLEDMTVEGFDSFLFEKLVGDVEDEDIEAEKNKIKTLMDVKFEEYINWYKFISEHDGADVVYHTYHSVKGLQFENVLVFMQNDFGGNNKAKFSNFFKSVGDDRENTRNLLYVACSRAVNNLSILYLDNIADFKTSIEFYFGDVRTFN